MVNFSKWKSEMGDAPVVQNDYILAFEGKAFFIQSLFVHEIEDYAAIGAGYPFAITALHLGKSPVEAVDVTCKICYLVSEPIVEEIMLK